MKTLTLIRHATANDKQISQRDRDRELSELGRFQAKNIAKQLKQKNSLPDCLLCSPAKRTMQTATIISKALQLDSVIQTENTIYAGDLDEILNVLYCLTVPKHLFVIGHNPNLGYLAHYFCAATNFLPSLPPAGVVSLQFDIENWHELKKTTGKLLFFIKPAHEPK